MVKEDRAVWKQNYFVRLIENLNKFDRAFIVGIDHVGSKQMQQIRISLRGKATVLMGKNTMIRKCIKGNLDQNPKLEKLMPHIRGNVGFVFTNEELAEVRELILANRVPAQARAGSVAPCDVIVPAQNTGLGPEKTSFFQALSIPTKISRGTIEILNDVPLIKTGSKVGASEATLLNMLKISPFTYGMIIEQVYDDGSVFPPGVLDLTDEELMSRVESVVGRVTAISLGIGYPTIVSAPHLAVQGIQRLIALSLATDYTPPQLQELKELMSDPERLAAMRAAATSAAADSGPAAAEEAPKDEPKGDDDDSDSDDSGSGFGGLFDD